MAFDKVQSLLLLLVVNFGQPDVAEVCEVGVFLYERCEQPWRHSLFAIQKGERDGVLGVA